MNITFPDPCIGIHGLPWLSQNVPHLYRFPTHVLDTLPERVATQARFPCGGRLRFFCTGKAVSVNVRGVTPAAGHGLDVFVDDAFWRTINIDEISESEFTVYEDISATPRFIEIYLPYRQEVQIDGLAIDAGELSRAPSYKIDVPIVFYGSSVAQGVGAHRSSMSYEAIISRRLNADFVNFGFGGAGKAESEVVDLVSQVAASCFILDLGKSYGVQSYDVYRNMLQTIRDRQPETPIICVTSIYSTRERYNSDYTELSEHTRKVVYRAADRMHNVRVVDGCTLLGSEDADGLSSDGVHPSELGFQIIADRLCRIIREYDFANAPGGT